MAGGTWGGLDVHARTGVAGGLGAGSGEVRSWRGAAGRRGSGGGLGRRCGAGGGGGGGGGVGGGGLDGGAVGIAFEESYAAVVQAKMRRDTLDQAIVELAGQPPFAEVVGRLCCLRGVSTLTALALTVELGDWQRFRPQSLGPFLGLTPSEDSTGERRRLGAITKTGNTHARRLPVEAAWHQRRPLRRSATLRRRRQGQSAAVRSQADQSARRLHQRWHALERRGKRRTIVAVAIARELAGHCWALATMK